MFDASSDDLEFTFDELTGVLAVSGGLFSELDARRLERQISEALVRVSHRLVVDLSDVTFFPTLAIRALILARRTASVARRTAQRDGAEVEVRAQSGTLPHRVLTATGFPLLDAS
ncbi:hypothetical protein RDV89_14180 [Nocardioides zeae]|uniref:STAS domain-containing protein n=1 Tax=Nocardioides imazamoxiresistens TaxID=3231893 RepID=A0ABU3PYA9_9ACTN|nr:hypothetical protein [Nocardioides zeae]MDT9594227.1 hypothetical protein [Nocardioides zeae]